MFFVIGLDAIVVLAILIGFTLLEVPIVGAILLTLVPAAGLIYLNQNYDTVAGIENYLENHWQILVLYIFIYVVIGVAWSAYKWYEYVRAQAVRAKDYRVAYDKLPIEKKKAYDSFGDCLNRVSDVNSNIDITRNKGKITYWIAFWWASLISTFFGTWLYNFFNNIYEMCTGLYKYIVKLAFSDVDMS